MREHEQFQPKMSPEELDRIALQAERFLEDLDARIASIRSGISLEPFARAISEEPRAPYVRPNPRPQPIEGELPPLLGIELDTARLGQTARKVGSTVVPLALVAGMAAGIFDVPAPEQRQNADVPIAVVATPQFLSEEISTPERTAPPAPRAAVEQPVAPAPEMQAAPKPAAAEVPAPQTVVATEKPAVHDKVTVVAGDTLGKIAVQWGMTAKQVAEFNGINPNLIKPGQVIKKPVREVTEFVDPGETVSGFALKYGVSEASIMSQNAISDPRRLQVGQKVIISNPTKEPQVAPVASAPAPQAPKLAPIVLDLPPATPTTQAAPKALETAPAAPQELVAAPAATEVQKVQIETVKLTAEQNAIIDAWDVSDARKAFAKEVISEVLTVTATDKRVNPEVLIAQIIIESQWGESLVTEKYFNFTGMKVGTDWTGPSVNMQTKEEVKGSLIDQRDNFRVYANMREGIKGSIEFITTREHFQDAVAGASSPERYLAGLQHETDAQGNILTPNKLPYATRKTYEKDNLEFIRIHKVHAIVSPTQTAVVPKAESAPVVAEPTVQKAVAAEVQAVVKKPSAEELAAQADRELARALIDPKSVRKESNGIQTVEVKGMRVNVEIADNLSRLLVAAAGDGINLTHSEDGDFRSPESQMQLRKENCPDPINSEPDDCKIPVAKPGTSNHERGRAIDFRNNGQPVISWKDPAAKWLKAHAAEFGFRNAIPKEPWHWSPEGN